MRCDFILGQSKVYDLPDRPTFDSIKTMVNRWVRADDIFRIAGWTGSFEFGVRITEITVVRSTTDHPSLDNRLLLIRLVWNISDEPCTIRVE